MWRYWENYVKMSQLSAICSNLSFNPPVVWQNLWKLHTAEYNSTTYDKSCNIANNAVIIVHTVDSTIVQRIVDFIITSVSYINVDVQVTWLKLGLHVVIFSTSIFKRFHRKSRSYWNEWGYDRALRCDFSSSYLCGEWRTCSHKIAVMRVNGGSRMDRSR